MGHSVHEKKLFILSLTVIVVVIFWRGKKNVHTAGKVKLFPEGCRYIFIVLLKGKLYFGNK